MAELLQHKHCKNCGRAIPATQDMCERAECAQEWTQLTRKRARLQLIFYGGAALFFLILVYQFLLPIL